MYIVRYNAEESENRKFICFNTIVDATVVLFLLFLSTILRALYFILMCAFLTLFLLFFLLLLFKPKTVTKSWIASIFVKIRTFWTSNNQTRWKITKRYFSLFWIKNEKKAILKPEMVENFVNKVKDSQSRFSIIVTPYWALILKSAILWNPRSSHWYGAIQKYLVDRIPKPPNYVKSKINKLLGGFALKWHDSIWNSQ